MKVVVRGKNKFEPTEAIKVYGEKKISKLDQYFSKSDELEAVVVCKVYDKFHAVEVTIPTKHIILRAEVKDETVYGAIDLAVDKLESQIKRHKSKIYSSLKRRDGVASYYASNSDFDLEKLNTEIMATNLVKNKSVDLVPMSPDDAVMQMEMLGHKFFIFLNSENNKTCVVYAREDGDYGIIETN